MLALAVLLLTLISAASQGVRITSPSHGTRLKALAASGQGSTASIVLRDSNAEPLRRLTRCSSSLAQAVVFDLQREQLPAAADGLMACISLAELKHCAPLPDLLDASGRRSGEILLPVRAAASVLPRRGPSFAAPEPLPLASEP